MHSQPTRVATLPRPRQLALALSAALVSLGLTGNALAFEFDTGGSDVAVRWDNTVRYTLGKRTGAQDPNILSPQGANYDDGDRNFKKGATVTNRVDLLTELDVIYKKEHGFRVSAAGWYDAAYRNINSDNGGPKNAAGVPIFENTLEPGTTTQTNGLSRDSKRYNKGPSGEFLDAFVFTNFNLGDAKVNAKLGQHTVYWGEGLSFAGAFNGISYSQMPLDLLKGLQFPGAEAKELFRPRDALTLQAQVNPNWSVAGQYFLDWQPARFPESGGYLAFYDVALAGGMSALSVNPSAACVADNTKCTATVLARGADITPKKSGDWGLSAHWTPDAIDASFGAYARRYTDQAPFLFYNVGQNIAVAALTPGLAAKGLCTSLATCATVANNAGYLSGLPAGNGSYLVGYQRNVDLLGLSFSTQALGTSIGGELSHRHNTPLATVNQYFVNNAKSYAAFNGAGKGQVPALNGLPGDVSADDLPVARGDTWHMLVNFLGSVAKTPLFDSAAWMAEVNYVRLDKVTKNESFYKGGDNYCYKDATGACIGTPIDKPTKGATNLSMTFTPTWFQALPNTDLSLPMSWSRGIRGNSPIGGITNKGTGSYSIGVGAKYAEKYLFDLRYVGYMGEIDTAHQAWGSLTPSLVSNGFTASLRDRGQILATLKSTF